MSTRYTLVDVYETRLRQCERLLNRYAEEIRQLVIQLRAAQQELRERGART